MSKDDPLAEYGPELVFPAPPSKRMSIAEIESILEHEDDVAIVILPNGEVRAATDDETKAQRALKPITMRENLGGEYAMRTLHG